MTAGSPPPDLPAEVEASVRAWMAQDPDPATRGRAAELLARARARDAAAVAELADAFAGPLTFGTAGLRGPLGPGPNRMNRVVVGQAAAGLAAYLLGSGLAGGRVLVGYDARHSSDVFAVDSAETMAGAGFQVLLADRPLPTPLVPFGVRHFGCVAGVVVTASHNPPTDNGYKVYLGDGCQIVPPADAEIAARIAEVAGGPLSDVPRSPAYGTIGDDLVAAYLDRIAGLVPKRASRRLSWVYTPLHGVGAGVVQAAVRRAGFPAPRMVAEQAEPDPDFPTVRFPNPEEPGAVDLALAEAARVGADLVVANDPDADRCAVAVAVDGQWRMLSGDELGVLLGEDALRRGVRGTYACSVVSGSLLAVIAAAYRQPFVLTLTGFKWIGRVPGLVYGYEEAIGYCVDPQAVPDKDGISALVRVLELAARLRAEGGSLPGRLDEIARRYGVHLTGQLAVRVSDRAVIARAMAGLRARPPGTLAGEPVRVTDLTAGTPDLPPTDAVRIAGDRVAAVVRPSGTEPKLKCYLEVRLPAAPASGPPADLPAQRAEAARLLAGIRAELGDVLGL